jgi:hypothetical protein
MITIRQGDATTLTETITGLTSLAGYTAKFYIYDTEGNEIDVITGSISGLVVTYQIVNEDSKIYPLGKHKYESKIWDAADHVYTTSSGRFLVSKTLVNDPS